MKFTPLSMAGAFRVDVEKREDERGFFARVFCAHEFAEHGLETTFVQMNTSVTRKAGSVRGMHFQRPPKAEVKFIRCVRGAVLDVIVDLREGSPTFGRWQGTELTGDNRAMLYVPRGFAHGFQTLADDSELFYMHSEFYSPEHEGGLRFDDPDVGIAWPLPIAEMSPRDRQHPFLSQVGSIRS